MFRDAGTEQMTGKRRWTPRRLAGMATIGTVIVVTGILTGAGSAIGQQNTNGHFTYTCRFSSGAQPVGVDIKVAFPSSAAIGQAVHPASATVTFAVPHAALRELTASHATTVGGIARLHTTVAQNGRSENATWANLVAPAKPIPATGELTLTASTTAPTITPRAPGDISFDAADLTMVLTPKNADGTSTDPATMVLGCTLGAGQHPLLATIPVPSATAAPGAGSSGPLAITPAPAARRAAGALDATATTPADCGLVPPAYPVDSLGLGLCGFLTGFANVNKLHGASPIAPKGAFINAFGPYEVALRCETTDGKPIDVPNGLACGQQNPPGVVHVFDCSFAQFENNGHQFELPPTRATFLAFGFEPVTATMHLTEKSWPPDHPPAPSPECGTGFLTQFILRPPDPFPNPAIAVTSEAVNNLSPDGIFTQTLHTTLETYLDVRISDATVDGVPLNVGPNCHTEDPVHSLSVADGAVINGVQTGYSFVSGGPVTGTIDIPSFTGCGVGEDLNPLFNAAVSSNDDFLKLVQGPLCTPSTQIGCPPTVPTPQR